LQGPPDVFEGYGSSQAVRLAGDGDMLAAIEATADYFKCKACKGSPDLAVYKPYRINCGPFFIEEYGLQHYLCTRCSSLMDEGKLSLFPRR
jgi:hypothetical protein